jgi:SAM-dependent methyltransferase
MLMIFGPNYAGIYDALYLDKDYSAEARFVLSKIGQPKDILDLGCGTGQHAIEFAKAGANVTGVDASESMLAAAQQRRSQLPSGVRERLNYQVGDARTTNLNRQFDAVVALFAVFGYMLTDTDLQSALATARRHLGSGQFFLFDYWYGPAVLASPPEKRERDFSEKGKRIKRTTTPTWDQSRDIVQVDYALEILDLSNGSMTSDSERHEVRYFFNEGVSQRLAESGFKVLEIREWLTGAPLSNNSFNAYALAEAI